MLSAVTRSVCPVCLKVLPAKRAEEGGNVYLEKTCPEHGAFRTLIWEGAPDYWRWGERHTPTRFHTRDGVKRGCPYDCGLCGAHRQRTCCVLLEVTGRCNLRCPVCFADAGGGKIDPGMETISGWYDMLCREAPNANIQLSGGEPTVRDDLPEIIRLGREKGFKYFQLNTNGLRLADDVGYARTLKDAGLNCVFLQFDGVSDDVYISLRGRALFAEKKRAIENCRAAGLGVVLVPVVAEGINLEQVGAIVDFALECLPFVKGVHFQPLTYFGRCEAEGGRVTLPRLMRELERQTGGRLKASDFVGGTAENAHCSFSANFLLEADGRITALRESACGCGAPSEMTGHGGTAFGTRESCCTAGDLNNAVDHARSTVARRWGGELPDEEPPPEDMQSLDGMLYQLRRGRFSVSAMAFQDCHALDLERLEDCYIHIVSPDGRLVPFCAYNLTSEDGTPLYRGR